MRMRLANILSAHSAVHATLISLVAFFVFLTNERHYFFSPILVADDMLILPGYMFDPLSVMLEDGPTHRLFSLLGQFYHPTPFRLVPLVAHSVLTGALYALLTSAGLSRWAAAICALSIVVTAVFPLQHVYVTGSHPIMG